MSYLSASVLAYGIAFHDTLPAFLNGYSGFADYMRATGGFPAFDSEDFDDDAFHQYLSDHPAAAIVEIGNGEGDVLTVIAANGAIHEAFDGEAIKIASLAVDKEVASAFADWCAIVGLADVKPEWLLMNVPVDLVDGDVDFEGDEAA